LIALIGVSGAFWLAFALLARWIVAAQPRPHSFEASVTQRVFWLYARCFQRCVFTGTEHIPARNNDGSDRPLIVVVNHTAGIDPVLVQAAMLRMEPRWMMASDMRTPKLEFLWQFGNIIFVDRDDPKPDSLRIALRHLRAGGALGIFPEGRIERPPRTLLPFQPGVGLLVKRSDALVLPVIVRGTPEGDTAWASITKRGRTGVEFLPIVDYAGTDLSAAEITHELREVYRKHTGWRVANEPSTPNAT
jgi:1-acyl-sn-glycerol-3-phosphate acyltransferase